MLYIFSAICLSAFFMIGIRTLKLGWFNKKITDSPFKSGTNDALEQSQNSAGGKKAYPYEKEIQCIPKDMPVSKYDDSLFVYNQIENNDVDIVDLYVVLYDSSYLRRNCHPMFDDNGNASFLRKSHGTDTDKKRYDEIVSYLGNKSTLMATLSELPQNTNKSLTCILFQNGKAPTTTGIGFEVGVYKNCILNIVAAKDFNEIDNKSVKNFVGNINAIKVTNTNSVIKGKKAVICYIYQIRFNKEKNIDEERFMYYTLFSQGDMDYLVQFSSNYTIQNSNKNAYGIEQDSQDKCKKAFEEIMQIIIDETN